MPADTVPDMTARDIPDGLPSEWLSTDEARELLAQPSHRSAPRLLGGEITGPDGVVLRVVEVEAYGSGDDPASHAHRGPTARNGAMFGVVGSLYAYRSYGIHTCLNIVSHPSGSAGGILLRAGEVVAGHSAAVRGREHLSLVQWASGPGRLGTALGYPLSDSGRELLVADLLRIRRSAASDIATGPRVGISRAKEQPWRFWLPGHPAVTRYRSG